MVAKANAGFVDTSPFVLTLCRLARPIAIPQPRAPHLKGLTFFLSRSRTPAGAERWLLHAGYFATAESAQQCLERLRGPYPNATVHTASADLLRNYSAGIPTLMPAQVPGGDSVLTDTQVLQILEQRGAQSSLGRTGTVHGRDIPLRRPDDTQVRRALKEAVLRNAPVQFAVQLLWSVQPIDLAQVPALAIFRAYTLYVAESRRERRSWHCLRLGFFNDAVSAKQVAHFVRSSFASVAVVPISEQEQARAKDRRIRYVAAQPESGSVPKAQPPSNTKLTRAGARPAHASVRRGEETLEQTLEQLAATELWSDEGSPADTGVRHLSVTITKRGSGQS